MFFLKMQGKRVWNFVEYGQRPPLILDAQGRSTRELKPKNEWDKVDNEGSEANAKALFIFLIEFIQKSFVGQQIVNMQMKQEIFFKSLMKVRLL